MDAKQGPVDDDIESMTELMFRYRGRRRDALSAAEKADWGRSLSKVWIFARKVGLFTTDDLEPTARVLNVGLRNIEFIDRGPCWGNHPGVRTGVQVHQGAKARRR